GVLRDPLLRLTRDDEIGLARATALLLPKLVRAPDPRAQVRRQLVPVFGAAPFRRRDLARAARPVAEVQARLPRSPYVLDLLVDPRRPTAAEDGAAGARAGHNMELPTAPSVRSGSCRRISTFRTTRASPRSTAAS